MILNAFPQQQWSCKRLSVLCYAYIACLVWEWKLSKYKIWEGFISVMYCFIYSLTFQKVPHGYFHLFENMRLFITIFVSLFPFLYCSERNDKTYQWITCISG